MYQIDFDKPVHVHFIGIGGISMSALAELLLSKNFTISGSDNKESELTKLLESKGCRIYIGQSKDNISLDIDVAVYTAAVKEGNEEYAACVKNNIPLLSRAQLLGQLMRNYDTAIGVAGTHGKTTTTSMISEILLKEECDPTITVGGILPTIGGNMRIGGTKVFLTEACEYTNSFLSFYPTVNVILNVEEDHLDFFKDLNDIRNSFKKYAELLPADGSLIINSGIEDYQYFCSNISCNVYTFGMDKDASNFSADNLHVNNLGFYEYTLLYNGKPVTEVSLSVPGIHNVLNSLAAIATCRAIGIDYSVIVSGLKAYTGVNRRFQIKGVASKGYTVVDDYAHHPSEITTTLTAAKLYPHKKIWCIFQPHTYTRTKAFLQEFANSLSLADHVVLAKIYEAREQDIYGVSSANIMELISKKNVPCEYLDNFGDIETFINDNCSEGDLVITMGAGNIYEVGENLLK